MLLDGVSFVVNMTYIFAMLYGFYLLIMAKNRTTLRDALGVFKICLALSCISLFCHMLSLDMTMTITDIVKIVGCFCMLWSTSLRIERMPMTEAERFEAEALRDLHKF